MKKWYEVVKEALRMLQHSDEYAYFYGAKGQRLTDDVMNALWNASPAYFAKYTKEQKKQIFNYSRNKIGYDCSGFVGHCVGDMTYSMGLKANCVPNKSLAEGVEGSIMWRNEPNRHVALDIGRGFLLEMGREMHSVELNRIAECADRFDGSGRHRAVDYICASENAPARNV